ncbi:hypothetical protein phytr_8090 [Candidatus Phycorickettsia trachydisci]|uniref:2'-5' RNA ligase n=1 Tax=Candidatus Phycorickettsia trachydisci TaxID=2115978 RepID=A0A2P1P8Z2_9RICK|nr:hypothetical protein [Candidatus Phycorickettsia trachydisci]AVP87742.1 hypothetical protein phytr_8090 [Candidatus Phycorickettsia trachydisci]
MRLLFILAIVIGYMVDNSLAIEFKKEVREYGIAVIPEAKCYKLASKLNQKISKLLPQFKNLPNIWHITLYQGAFEESDLVKIESEILKLNIKKFDITLTKFYTTADRWVDWGVEKTDIFDVLHRKVVNIASRYHLRPLNRVQDMLDGIEGEIKKQIDMYGTFGLMNFYKPHMTLFYLYPPSKSISKIPQIIEDGRYEGVSCKSDKLIIGELGYNGNIIRVVNVINLATQN